MIDYPTGDGREVWRARALAAESRAERAERERDEAREVLAKCVEAAAADLDDHIDDATEECDHCKAMEEALAKARRCLGGGEE